MSDPTKWRGVKSAGRAPSFFRSGDYIIARPTPPGQLEWLVTHDVLGQKLQRTKIGTARTFRDAKQLAEQHRGDAT